MSFRNPAHVVHLSECRPVDTDDHRSDQRACTCRWPAEVRRVSSDGRADNCGIQGQGLKSRSVSGERRYVDGADNCHMASNDTVTSVQKVTKQAALHRHLLYVEQ